MATKFTAVGGNYIPFKSWCGVALENPTANLPVTNAYSDTDSSWDGTTTGHKMIFNFEKSVTILNSHYAQLYIGDWGGGSSFASITLSTGAVFGTGTLSAALSVRWRPITASFVTANQTWNTLGSLTIGSGDNAGFASFGISTLSGDVQRGGPWQANAPTTKGGPAFRVTGPVTAYGFIVDVQPVTAHSLNSGSVTGVAAQLAVSPNLTVKAGVIKS